MSYDYKTIEPKWQKIWEEKHAFEAKNDYTLPKYYALVEFPYPSGQGLHIGHPRPYTAIDIIARKGNVVAFVEVKRRKTFDDAAYCIDERTKARRIAGAQYYLSTNGEAADLQPRFDAVLISAGGPPVHLENAWECESL